MLFADLQARYKVYVFWLSPVYLHQQRCLKLLLFIDLPLFMPSSISKCYGSTTFFSLSNLNLDKVWQFFYTAHTWLPCKDERSNLDWSSSPLTKGLCMVLLLFQGLEQRHNAVLQMYGEKAEECEELRMDLEDVKTMYKTQVNEPHVFSSERRNGEATTRVLPTAHGVHIYLWLFSHLFSVMGFNFLSMYHTGEFHFASELISAGDQPSAKQPWRNKMVPCG